MSEEGDKFIRRLRKRNYIDVHVIGDSLGELFPYRHCSPSVGDLNPGGVVYGFGISEGTSSWASLLAAVAFMGQIKFDRLNVFRSSLRE